MSQPAHAGNGNVNEGVRHSRVDERARPQGGTGFLRSQGGRGTRERKEGRPSAQERVAGTRRPLGAARRPQSRVSVTIPQSLGSSCNRDP